MVNMVEKTLEKKQHVFDVEKTIEILLRGCEDINYKEQIIEKVSAVADLGRVLEIKFGMDPTSPELHIGHAVALRKIRQLQELGHHVNIVIGDFTATIGDPEGRSTARKTIDQSVVDKNLKTYREQVFKIIHEEQTEIYHNSEWYNLISGEEFIDLLSRFKVSEMLARKGARSRIESENKLYCHELIYPILQGLDSIMIGSHTDIEMGGNDQLFNIELGSKIQKMFGFSQQVGLYVPILDGIDGRKMSKSYGNHIGLNEDTKTAFKKIMDIPDELVIKYFELATDVPYEKIKKYKQTLENGSVEEKTKVKEELAKSILYLYHSKEEVDEASTSYETAVYHIEGTDSTTAESPDTLSTNYNNPFSLKPNKPIRINLKSDPEVYKAFFPHWMSSTDSLPYNIISIYGPKGSPLVDNSKKEKADKIVELLFDGIKIHTDKYEEIRNKIIMLLELQKVIRFKFSINPTSYGTNLRHFFALRKMRKLQELGCGIDVVIENYSVAHDDNEEIKDNCFQQMFKIIDIKKTKIYDSLSWFKNFSTRDIIKLLSRATINDLLTTTSNSNGTTIKPSEDGMCCDQLVYPLLEALGVVATNSDFDIVDSKENVKSSFSEYVQKACGYPPISKIYIPTLDVYVKSDTNDKSIETDYQTIMKIPDDKVAECFKQLTNLPIDEISMYEQDIKSGKNPINIKMRLADAILSQIYPEEGVEKAKKSYIAKTQRGVYDIPSLPVANLQINNDGKTFNVLRTLKSIGVPISRGDFFDALNHDAIYIDRVENTDGTKKSRTKVTELNVSVDAISPDGNTTLVLVFGKKPKGILQIPSGMTYSLGTHPAVAAGKQ